MLISIWLNFTPIIYSLNIMERCKRWEDTLEEGEEMPKKTRGIMRGYGSNLALIGYSLKCLLQSLQSQRSKLDTVMKAFEGISISINSISEDCYVKIVTRFTKKTNEFTISEYGSRFDLKQLQD